MQTFLSVVKIDPLDARLLQAAADVMLLDERETIPIQHLVARCLPRGTQTYRFFTLEPMSFRLGLEKQEQRAVRLAESGLPADMQPSQPRFNVPLWWMCWTGDGPPPPLRWDPRSLRERIGLPPLRR